MRASHQAQEDARTHGDLADAIRPVFNRRYLDATTGRYARHSQTTQALPLTLDLVPADKRRLVLDQLVRSLTGPRRNHVSTGIVGVLYLFHALMEQQRDDLAWAIIMQEDYPGWMNMINQGGTSM